MSKLYAKTFNGMDRFNAFIEKYALYFVTFAAGYFLHSILMALV